MMLSLWLMVIDLRRNTLRYCALRATCYVLPGCISEGDNREGALDYILETIACYLDPVEDDMSHAADAEVTKVIL